MYAPIWGSESLLLGVRELGLSQDSVPHSLGELKQVPNISEARFPQVPREEIERCAFSGEFRIQESLISGSKTPVTSLARTETLQQERCILGKNKTKTPKTPQSWFAKADKHPLPLFM